MEFQEAVGAAIANEDKIIYKDSTYELVSKVAYLIGVPRHIFENEHEAPQMEVFERLEADKAARIIRHLSIIRTAIERNFRHINSAMRIDYRTILSMPEHVPADSLHQLSADGINFIKKSSTKLVHHVIEINRLISDRINNCKKLFPLWISWDYIKDLFIMPNGLKEEGTRQAAYLYYANRSYYPYQVYINWGRRMKAMSSIMTRNLRCCCINGTMTIFASSAKSLMSAAMSKAASMSTSKAARRRL